MTFQQKQVFENVYTHSYTQIVSKPKFAYFYS